ncbi:MAG: hypothetical protein RSD67_04950 [Oscillospiraceae bacterium]
METKDKKSLKDVQIPNWVAVVVILVIALIIGIIFFIINKKDAPAMITSPDPNSSVIQTDGTSSSAEIATDVAVGSVESSSDASNQSSLSADAISMEILPKRERAFTGTDTKNPFVSLDLSSLLLRGIVINSNNTKTAVIETNSDSLIVTIGDTLKDTGWKVESIDLDSITFVNDTSKKTLYMLNN